MGAKRRNTTFWQPTDLKADASIPAQGDIALGASYIDCSDIKLSAVGAILGPGNLYDLCNYTGTFVAGGESGKINAWARYKPGQVDYSVPLPANCFDNPSFTYTPPGTSGARLGDFAGYNHAEASRPVWWASPHNTEGTYVVWSTIAIRGGLQRGKLCPVLQTNPEDETFWGRVKVQTWLKVNNGAYSLIGTSDFIDLSEPAGDDATLLFTMGSNGESIGNTYTLCLRPVYMDTDGTTPLAVCEGGVEILTYRMWGTSQDIADAFSITINSIATSHPSQYTQVDYDFDLNNLMAQAADLRLRLRAEDNDAWFTYDYVLGTTWHVNASSYLNFANTLNLGQTLYGGTFKLYVQISFDSGATWITVGSLGDTLQHWASQ